MKKVAKLLIFPFLISIFLVFSPAHADFGVIMMRMMAVIFPDSARHVCREQNQELKDELEHALQMSGLAALNAEDICTGGICDPGTISSDLNLERMRVKQIQSISKQSFDENTEHCRRLAREFSGMGSGADKSKLEIFDNFYKIM